MNLYTITVETLRQLILRDLEEDAWSHDSDDTPTNETANEQNSFSERQRPESQETILSVSTNEWEAEPEEAPASDAEQPSVQVIRKGNGEITNRSIPFNSSNASRLAAHSEFIQLSDCFTNNRNFFSF